MRYIEYSFRISETGLLLDDKAEPKEFNQVQLSKTPLNVGDKFELELDADGCMFFKKMFEPDAP